MIRLINIILVCMVLTGCKKELKDKFSADVYMFDSPSAICKGGGKADAKGLCSDGTKAVDLCQPDSLLWYRGIYRKITCTPAIIQDAAYPDAALRCKNNTKGYYEEYISYCDAALDKSIAMKLKQFQKWTDIMIDNCK